MIDTGCEWVTPIWLHRLDVLTEHTKRQIIRHNETWEAVCDAE